MAPIAPFLLVASALLLIQSSTTKWRDLYPRYMMPISHPRLKQLGVGRAEHTGTTMAPLIMYCRIWTLPILIVNIAD